MTVRKITATILSLFMLQMSDINYFLASATESNTTVSETENDTSLMTSEIPEQALSLDALPDSLYNEIEANLQNAVKLEESTYSDLFSISTINDDGTKSIMSFNNPVKYYDDETGDICFIDNAFVSAADDNDIAFENSGNSYNAQFPVNVNDGVVFSESNFSITMKPINVVENCSPQIINNELVYSNAYNEDTDICYSLEHSGIKESIIVDEPTGCSRYYFEISAEGLVPDAESGKTITLFDETTDEPIFVIQPIFIMDSYVGEYIDGEEHTTYDNYYDIELQDDGTYLLCMNLDEEFLNADSTVYPCIIDPTIWAAKQYDNSSSYVLQSGGSAYVNNQLSVGTFNGSGEHISYVKSNSIEKYRWIEPDRLESVEFKVKADSSGYTNACTIGCYDSTLNSSVSSVTYSSLISSLGTLQSSTTFTTLGATYSFDVTELFRSWISYELGEGGKNPDYGFILRGVSGSSTPGRYFSSTSSSDTYFNIRYHEGEELDDGFYAIRNVSTGNYLKFNNGGALNFSSSLNDSCKWQLILSKSEDRATTYGAYAISPFNNLNVSMSGTTTGQSVTTQASGNYFRIIRNADDTFRIMPAGSNYANVSNAIGISSGYATLQEYSNISTMKWTFEPVVNRFFSEYTPEKINNSEDTKHRLNCYAYAFGFVEYYDISYDGKQHPGYFASDDEIDLAKNLFAYDDSQELMNIMVYNMNLDASRFGYSLTEYTTENDTVEQFGSNSRLIAVITQSNSRYHFYMQHNDGTWSHKSGDDPARDTAFSSTDSVPKYLNNGNIKEYVYDDYSGGVVKFFIITKDAVRDYPHGNSNSPTQNVLYFTDMAGDNMFTASSISTGTKEACFDTNNDVDFFVINSPTTKVCTITTACESGYDIECEIYDYNGNLIISDTITGQVNKKFPVLAGKNCFIKIYNHDNCPGEYTITIT